MSSTAGTLDAHSLARELMEAYATRRLLPVPLSAREPAFDLTAAYAVEAELVRLRRTGGARTVGRKVGYANRAVWRALGLDTLVWAHMYDDTVRYAQHGQASLPVGRMCSPRIEPEIVVGLRTPPAAGGSDPTAVLESIAWLALGFEIVDCVFADWRFKPQDFVAAFGLHAALVVGEPLTVQAENVSALAEQLPRFTVRLMKDDVAVADGSGRNALRSPALCVAELASAIARRPDAEPLQAGELVSTGTLTEPQAIGPGETWTASVEGIELKAVTLETR